MRKREKNQDSACTVLEQMEWGMVPFIEAAYNNG